MKISDFSRIPFVMKFIRQPESHLDERDVFLTFTYMDYMDAWAVRRYTFDKIQSVRHEYSHCLETEQFRVMVNPKRSKVPERELASQEITQLRLVAYVDPETLTVMDTSIMPSARERMAQEEFWDKCEWCADPYNREYIAGKSQKGTKWDFPPAPRCPNRLPLIY